MAGLKGEESSEDNSKILGDGFGCCEPPSTLIMGFGIFVLLLLFVLFLDDISCTTLTSLLFSESGIIASKSASDKEPKTEVLLDLLEDSGFLFGWAILAAAEVFLFSVDGVGFFLGSLDSVEPVAVVVTVL